MPKKDAVERAKELKRKGKSPSTQASEFVREEMRAYEEGKGAKSPSQAVAIGLSKARRAGVHLPPPKDRPDVRKKAERDLEVGERKGEL